MLNLFIIFTEKLAEATRKYAGLQSDLFVAENNEITSNNNVGLRRRVPSILHKNKNPEEHVIRKSMRDIKLAFSEFYLSLILLQNYQSLNFTGFRKILKKHDKVINRHHCCCNISRFLHIDTAAVELH